ncbi:hypothetical protein [Nonomuraea guangzhouensis]|uniref:Uncharacterized protein n=1 Tax=Nonomuraea guangzhouensis TaxID=1291555 RepID=A0ABW4G8Y6_9ACTN|nr:hypothetical protein [Nonomuraea guangzhouensis]
MRRGILAAIPLALALALTGCGANEGSGANVASVSSGKPAAAPSASAGEDRAAKGLKFAQCMREHGVPMDDPEPGKGVMLKLDNSVPRETAEKAQEACKEYAPNMDGGAKADPKMAEQMRKYSQCMRDNGVEAFPDPDGGMLRMDSAAGEDPDFKTAQEKCKEFMPGMRQGGS